VAIAAVAAAPLLLLCACTPGPDVGDGGVAREVALRIDRLLPLGAERVADPRRIGGASSPCAHRFAHGAGRQADAILVILDFLGAAYAH